MSTTLRSMDFYHRGGAVLQEQLGPGDCTAERQARKEEETLEDLCGEIRNFSGKCTPGSSL